MAKRAAPKRRAVIRGPAPRVVVLAGPNGAGKTTAASRLLRGALNVPEFLNADLIAKGLSPFDPERVAWEASEILLNRMEQLAGQGVSFGIESTLAARSLAPRIQRLIDLGYEFHLVFLWLSSADVAVARVADRVRLGGHNVPEETIRRRYAAGVRNFFELYQILTTTWRVYDNSVAGMPRFVAAGRGSVTTRVAEKRTWNLIRTEHEP